ncbi:hypothetical protein HHK36_012172 [Tetracentron sinense]|uniref:Transmembrane protein n=1 Tax=Tetracentron sinense TaxID=13715 RepID=A0A834Z6C5_TETSI|nr:hypothetical protein HHK36_012172 [Tetracentron sinense]
MALVIYWYDFICFAIIISAIFGSLWMLQRREGAGKCEDRTMYESLLLTRPDSDEFVGPTPSGHVSSTRLWSSCWQGLHPMWLLGFRLFSGLVMVGLLVWDVLRYDTSIFVYYTEVSNRIEMAKTDDEGLGYWLRWQVPVCALIFVVPAVLAVVLIRRVNRAPLNVNDLWIPCWRKLHPIWLLIYRAFVFVFMFWLLYLIVAEHGAFAFYFYTQWTFTLVIVYFALGTIISAHGCWNYSKEPLTKNEERNEFLTRDLAESKSATTITFRTDKVRGTIKLQSHHDQEETERRAGFWGYLMQAMYQTCAGAVMLTDIVFWCLIVPFLSTERFGLNLLMGCMHSLNLIFLLIDSSVNNLIQKYNVLIFQPFPWFRMAYFVLWSCLYVIFQWVIHACGFTWWPYPFLELSTPWAPLWYLCLSVVHIPCYGVYALVIKAKNYIFSRLFPRAYLRSY